MAATDADRIEMARTITELAAATNNLSDTLARAGDTLYNLSDTISRAVVKDMTDTGTTDADAETAGRNMREAVRHASNAMYAAERAVNRLTGTGNLVLTDFNVKNVRIR